MPTTVQVGSIQIFKNRDGSLRIVDKESGTITNVQPKDRNYPHFLRMYKEHGGT